ncbi:hypothetical protein GCM10009639_38010 [Kitasatospora putterlickiae]|uniref:DUF4232 domain-containing protein n=1 Tax=Kitasatospora putterlickiae TaxID=221725 RepID=A0ABN1Y609_9ACTN
MIVPMDSTPLPQSAVPGVARRAPRPVRTGLPLAAGALVTALVTAGCGSIAATGAGGGAPGPARSIGDTPLPVTSLPVAPAPATACSPEGLALTVGEANAAMGLRVMPVRLTNCGTRPYALKGHPAVRVLDAERAPLAITVKRGSAGIATLENFDAAPAPLILQPQEYAESHLVWRNTVAAGDKAPDNGRFLDLAPLQGRPRLTVPAHLDLGTTGRLGVAPWTKTAP